MGIDLGTSACKTVIFSLDGRKISEAQKEYPIYHPKPRWAEQKPADWWHAASWTIRESLSQANLRGDEVAAVSVTSQREAVVPVGKEGKELYNSIIWLDNRTGSQVLKIEEAIDEEKVLSITGVTIDPIFSASKILWLRDNVPEAFQQALCFLCAKDYIVYKLTGTMVTDYSMASRTMLFDIKKRAWSDEICSTLDIPMDKLPEAKESSAVIGEVSSKAHEETGLPKGLPVVNGGGDRPCECLGSGATQEGLVNIGTGTGSVVEVPLENPAIDLQGRINCCCHVIPNTWEYEAIIATTGASLRWFRDTFGYEEKAEAQRQGLDPYDLLTERAASINPGSEGLFFYPHLTGAFSPKFNEKARGVFFGINLSHSKGHFVRAILEGVAFQYKGTFEFLEALDVKVKEASMVGGETKSRIWNQIKADVLGIIIRVPQIDDAAALGAALLAGTGTRQYSSLYKAAEEAVRTKKVYRPNRKNRGMYEIIYRNYQDAYASIEEAFKIY